jgi:pimeloyl-ACP methyl ester carboxylesterase
VSSKGVPVVLAVHSASGFSGYAASDRVPGRIAAMVYVDTAPGIPPLDPAFVGVEKSLLWSEIEAEENLDGLSDEQKATFRERAVPVPGGVLRGGVDLVNEARTAIPSTIICTSFPSEAYQRYARESDWAWLAGIREIQEITWVDLPTSHWPMWSRPRDLAAVIGDGAVTHGSARE